MFYYRCTLRGVLGILIHLHDERHIKCIHHAIFIHIGSCGQYGGSVGVVEIEAGKIVSCRILDGESF